MTNLGSITANAIQKRMNYLSDLTNGGTCSLSGEQAKEFRILRFAQDALDRHQQTARAADDALLAARMELGALVLKETATDVRRFLDSLGVAFTDSQKEWGYIADVILTSKFPESWGGA